MSANTNIEWCDHTFNPWTGCMKVSPGCDGCYAEAWSKRAGAKVGKWGPGAPRVRTSATNWKLPLKWEAAAAAFQVEHGRRQRVFCASLADVFDNEVDPQWRYELFNLILSTPSLDWLLLTKRIGNAARMIDETLPASMKALPADCPVSWPWPNVWIGATIVNQEEADRDIPKLLQVPAAKRFLSMEPLLGAVDLQKLHLTSGYGAGPCTGCGSSTYIDALSGKCYCDNGCDGPRFPRLDWVIAGGESGPAARPSHPDWYRSLRDQCEDGGVAFLFKQWGEWAPRDQWNPRAGKAQLAVKLDGRLIDEHTTPEDVGAHRLERVGKAAAGRDLDGRTYDEIPA